MSITKGGDTYTNGASVPLDVGANLIAIVVTATDGSTAPHTYRVTVTRAHNTPPVFEEGAAATRGVDEDTGAGQDIGDALAASDADSADTLTYSLDTASDAFFDIDSATGQLRTEAELDHETRKSYSVSVSVSDGKDANGDADASADSTITVTVLVSDVNESASFGSVDPTRTIEENTPAGEPLGAPFQATDGDGDTLTYSLGANRRGGLRDRRGLRPAADQGSPRLRGAVHVLAGCHRHVGRRQQQHRGHRHRRERGGAGRGHPVAGAAPGWRRAERPPDRSRHGL